MTSVQTQPRPAGARPAHRSEVAEAAGPRVSDDMSVEVALAVMAAARTGRLVVCDQDDERIGLVTRTDLIAVRDSRAPADRVRLRDLLGDHGTCASPATTTAGTAGHATRPRRIGDPRAAAEQTSAPGLFALSR
ncbi:CBS-domain-containing membrane protein [Streptomyces sp. 3330]|uniref:CBS domain-containing protein n=1 Tax=Streptomyces sp. 3330 TaxID=2817755 RepID=UPI00285656CD|nr:CBS domain-containing protein [Streptomyces sp. 3330]MDR6979982.1 CBS-domain-containing membrane protein [Streptomyces sp. 3330]